MLLCCRGDIAAITHQRDQLSTELQGLREQLEQQAAAHTVGWWHVKALEHCTSAIPVACHSRWRHHLHVPSDAVLCHRLVVQQPTEQSE